MDYFELLKRRRSVRMFLPQAVEPGKLQAILEAANLAPSAGNLQSYEIFLVTKPDSLHKLARASLDQDFIAQAPLALVFCANPGRAVGKYGQRGTRLYCIQDATIACTYAQLALTALGLASVWVGAFRDDEVRKAIGVGEELIPVAILPMGYPGEMPEARSRRELSNLVHVLDQN